MSPPPTPAPPAAAQASLAGADLREALRLAAAGERAARATAAEAGNPGWRIAPMRGADLVAVRAIDAAAFPHNPWQTGGYPAAMARRGAYVMRLADGTVAGMHVVRSDADVLHLVQLAVRDDLQGLTLGRWLLRWGLLYANETGASRAVLHVREDNARAIAVYLAAGLHVSRRIENHYETGCRAALQMEIVCGAHAPAAGDGR